MNDDLVIPQAVVGGGEVVAASPGFADAWRDEAVRVAAAYGRAGTGMSCDGAVFALPFAGRVAVVAVGAGPRFRFLVPTRRLYDAVPDPFFIASRVPADFDARHPLPDVEWSEVPSTYRTIAKLDGVLKAGDGPFLLGASQALVDSGRILLDRSAPDAKTLADLWALLPDSTRRATWPATFAPTNDLGFSVVALPGVPEGGVVGYLSEDQARDYPDSRYERTLQVVIEAGDQRGLDRLLARRTGAETLRLAGTLVVAATAAAVVLKLVG